MVETFYCFDCQKKIELNELQTTIEFITYDGEADEIQSLSHLRCPKCESIIIGCCEILSLSSRVEE